MGLGTEINKTTQDPCAKQHFWQHRHWDRQSLKCGAEGVLILRN